VDTRSGRRSLVIGATAGHVVGMAVEDGRALLDDLLARATAPERVLRHRWSPGDLLIFDNSGTLHRALPYHPAQPRRIHRSRILGDEAIR
jgi:alpha-ketoglutarate-dependent taurine dioxygenase